MQKMSSSSVAGPSRRANIIRVVRQTSGFAQAFRKLVSRALCVQLPSPEWTVGYYKNPLNPTDKVLVFSSSAICPEKCLIIREDMSCMETVGGFRRDRVTLERVMSSLHLERVLQGLHAASICPGWAMSCRRRLPPNTLLRGRSFHAINCWGLLDLTMADTTLCPPCMNILMQTKQVERVEIPSNVLIDQKKTVQRFRTRLRVHLYRAKQLLKKKKRITYGEQTNEVKVSECASADINDDNTADVEELVEKVKHHDVKIAFEHNGTRYAVVLDKLYQLPPPIFQGAMRIMAGPAARSSQTSATNPVSCNRFEAAPQQPAVNPCRKKRKKLDTGPSFQEQTKSTIVQPTDRRNLLCRDIRIDFSEQADQTNFLDGHTVVLQIEQVLNDNWLETRKICVNGAPTGALSMFRESGAPLPRHLQDAIQQLFTNTSSSSPIQPQNLQETLSLPSTTMAARATTLVTYDDRDMHRANEPSVSVDVTELNTTMEADYGDRRFDVAAARAEQAAQADEDSGSSTSAQAQVVVDLDEGLPSEHAGLPLEAMQLQIDTDEQL
ncbi:uncharacterized protein LOC111258911 isoform X3 [Varroa jacobsoni]|uniref:Uncharacterized protein n=1 Tax=Varroa destructor TaxID=109461 RepID=A0A7M7JMP6_VARDE|nr:uncharacterized protein LOC111247612 isoform X4 [Varroa destructor]XP_022686225.1 uncharacterized protein LOC111258911 isoform X3 [Varroa jacobsoni]